MNELQEQLLSEVRADVKDLLAFKNRLLGVVVVASALTSGMWAVLIAWITHK